MAEERLSGDLGLISLFDVAQLLLVNRASGVLTIREGSIARFLYFGEGAIVNAVDEERREGDEAAFNVLTTLRGTFSFDPTKGPEMKLVTLPANALLMEAARRMDEQAAEAAEAAAAADGATTVDPNTAPRPSHLRSLDLLSEAFREISGARPRGSSEMGPIVFEHPDDIAVIRPGLPVRIRSHGEWRESGPAVDDVDIMAVRQRLLDGAAQLPFGPFEIAAGPQGAAQRLQQLLLVVHEQHGSGSGHSGSTISMVVRPGAESSAMVPPRPSTMFRAMGSPRPVPARRVVK